MSTLRAWARDLALGARFAFGGGRQGWTRTLLTGVGVGLGVALLLISTAVPGALTARHEREDARSLLGATEAAAPGRDTLLIARIDQTYRHLKIGGRVLRAEGPDAPVPPGLQSVPKAGEMVVSPALKQLLASPEGAGLRERLGAEITGTVADRGLTGPAELLFYLGDSTLPAIGPGEHRIQRITAFAGEPEPRGLDPVLMLLVVLAFVALLTPVAVFVAAAVRFGGERRDQRLAALRLVGADSRTVRRIAACEALSGALTGLVLGAGFFLVGRALAESLSFRQRSVFPHDLDPSPWLALLVALAVPAAAVAVTVFALRRVVIEPLGVARTAAPRRRRVWWRLLLPLAGLGLLVPLGGQDDEHRDFNRWQVGGGVVLLLVAVTVLLPWLLERTVGRLSGGPASWQLAVRRLQVDSGGAARMVNGIAVAVAGAIALQMVFTGVEEDYERPTGQDPGRATVSVLMHMGTESRVDALAGELAAAPGVVRAVALTDVQAARAIPADGQSVRVTVGTCEALREVAELGDCAEGDAFALSGGGISPTGEPLTPAPGERLYAGNITSYGMRELAAEKPVEWTVPAGARTVRPVVDPFGALRDGLLVTPSAAPKNLGSWPGAHVFVQADESRPDALDAIRTAVFKAEPFATVTPLRKTSENSSYTTIRTGLFFGAAGLLVVIGTSLLVAQLEQLRERRRLLAALVAFGTPRRTLGLSVLWQTALPIGLGLSLATGAGLALGSTLLWVTGRPVRVDWASVLALAGAGAGVVAAVTLLSLPPLLRLMRPDGLRTE
ncbi:FtsX-like permease family protein [Streptomyces sp. 3211.6]|uniref:ABC transporter permease n=1 Tax=Streptomyces sp. 3211.6 TaxID=1938845 RepID=UPI000EAE5C75|nr:FtsX-like permease family protein [Streptomyces sp. 3211.6]RKT06650.1 FtsX-like permease family protein [Streptomyces sp. 3211.6]